ncbi:MAG TPA: hypothetical protein VNI57_06600 [Candidatus Saccharimonadales bacterium]|nr:hypothetical protein [Candidatus Saccharimonadales bacterium]
MSAGPAAATVEDPGGGISAKPAPFVVITTDGHRFDAMKQPEKTSGNVKIRLAPTGLLTLYPSDKIDWAATERYNAPQPSPQAAQPSGPEDENLAAYAGKKPGAPLEMTIIGTKGAGTVSESSGSGKAGQGTEAGSEGGAEGAAGAEAPSPEKAKDQLQELTREMSALKNTYEGTQRLKSDLESRISDLEAKAALEPEKSPDEKFQSPVDKALADARQQLQAANDQLSALEQRMNDIRIQAMNLGGAID